MKKFTNKKGFTIMEMLIVVAIIAVLVAIAIPTFSSALTKTREAADVANLRAAYAAVQVEILTEDKDVKIVGTDDKAKAEAFVKYAGDSVVLNEAGNVAFADTTGGSATKSITVTYNPTKLTGGNGTAKDSSHQAAYVWTIERAELATS